MVLDLSESNSKPSVGRRLGPAALHDLRAVVQVRLSQRSASPMRRERWRHQGCVIDCHRRKFGANRNSLGIGPNSSRRPRKFPCHVGLGASPPVPALGRPVPVRQKMGFYAKRASIGR